MHIVIPMSGTGKRFMDAGYKQLKPLVTVDKKPMISYVVSMFPREHKFTFICNEEHLRDTNMEAVLKGLVPECKIIPIKAHKKGPVWAVSQCHDAIDDDEEVIVNYCDFYSYWDYEDFLRYTRERNAAGCIPSYRGFHPHMLGTDNYAFIRDRDQWLLEIREKMPFTDDRMREFASNGTYYFQKGRFVKKYFDLLIERNIEVNGEYYVSMVYNLMVEDGLPVSVYEIQHMLQWGTPKDLEEYQSWSDYFRSATGKPGMTDSAPVVNGVNLIPMAGAGERFRQAGIETPKPLLKVNGSPMFVQAARSLPTAPRYLFVAQKNQFDSAFELCVKESFPQSSVVLLDKMTQGQAESCALGISLAEPPVNSEHQLTIGACDNGMVFSRSKFEELVNETGVDAVAFTFRNHPSSARNPQMYGWIKTENEGSNRAVSVSVKKAISNNPRMDHAIVGSFYFRQAKIFLEAFQSMKANNVVVNGEYYVDSLFGELIKGGFDCRVFEVDQYICWGTPDDWKTFQYWQSFFHKCDWHQYRIELDPDADPNDLELRQFVDRRLVQACR